MLARPQPRRNGRGACLLAACLLTASPAVLAQSVCQCTQQRTFGSCRNMDVALTNPYPGDFPGPLQVVENANGAFILLADIFGGSTYVYDAANLLLGGPTEFASPRGTTPTNGLAWVPSEDRLYWALENRLIVTEVPELAIVDNEVAKVDDEGNPLPAVFDDLVSEGEALEFEVDLAALAEGLFGDPERAGRLGDITYHAGRGTLWGVDIVNDVYFEMSLTGELVLEDGEPVHFTSPAVTEVSPKAFGNSITYAVLDDGREFFDILTGSQDDGRPSRVERVLAPTEPTADAPLGGASGLGYPIFGSLTAPGLDSIFPTNLAYWSESCDAMNNSELIVGLDRAGDAHMFIEVNADDPQVANVAGLTCEPSGESSVQLTWRNTGGYDELEIFRSRITDGGPEESVFSTSAAEDPQEFADASFPVPLDGTYTYRAVTRAGEAGEFEALPASCTVTLGRGAVIDSRSLAEVAGGTSGDRLPYAVTRAGSRVLVADAESGVARRFDANDLSMIDEVVGPFAVPQGATTGLAWDSTRERLHWLGTVRGAPRIGSTDADGRNPEPLRPVQYPPELVRTPEFGDLAYDPLREQFWVSDVFHDVVFAVRSDGTLVPGSMIASPFEAGTLGGGVEVAGATEDEVTLDIVGGPGSVADRLVRNRYTLADLTSPETLHTVLLQPVTRSIAPGGIALGTRNDTGVHFLVGTDTQQLYVLRADSAPVGDLPFRRGDSNNDGALNISDASFTLSHLFQGGDAPPCENAADTNDDGTLDMGDPLMLFDWLFRDGPPPAEPGADCGFDSTPSDLGCEASACADLG